MGKSRLIVTIILLGIGFIVVGIAMQFGPIMLEGFEETRLATAEYTDIDTTVETAGSVTTGNMTLTYTLPNNAVAYVTSVTSNVTETPVADNFSGELLYLTGLDGYGASAGNRTLTCVYEYRSAGYYTAFGPVVEFGPTMILLGFVVAVGVIGYLGIRLVRRRG